MNRSESIKELSAALAKAQGDMSNPKKNANNPYFGSKYADLSAVINASKPILADNGLSVVQLPSMENGEVNVETILLHSTGEFISSSMSMRLAKNDAQGIGSCVTYIRRYCLAAILGIAQEDDDGNEVVVEATKQANDGKTLGNSPKKPPPKEQVEVKYYPQDEFDKNVDVWRAAIAANKVTVKQLCIKGAKGKGTLTPEMIKRLEA